MGRWPHLRRASGPRCADDAGPRCADDGGRMRIAAERCAEPQARAVLTRTAAGEEDDERGTADERLLRLRPRGP